MGGAHEICTDKTGTLTLNQMTCKEIYSNGSVSEAIPSAFSALPQSIKDLLLESVIFNCSARVEFDSEEQKYITKGNCTECGLLHFLMDCQLPISDRMKNKCESTLEVIPFNSQRKRATTAYQHDKETVRIFCKGAPEIVLNHCTTQLVDGE